MRYRGLIAALIGTSALYMTAWLRRLVRALGRAIASVILLSLMTSCGSSRQATAKSSELRAERVETVDSSKVESLVVLDSLKEITTITIDRNDKGDTLRLTQVTDRTRATTRDKVKNVKEKVVVKTDTVFVERRDSVSTSDHTNFTNERSRASPVVSALKWIFWIIISLTVLIVIIKLNLK